MYRRGSRPFAARPQETLESPDEKTDASGVDENQQTQQLVGLARVIARTVSEPDASDWERLALIYTCRKNIDNSILQSVKRDRNWGR